MKSTIDRETSAEVQSVMTRVSLYVWCDCCCAWRGESPRYCQAMKESMRLTGEFVGIVATRLPIA